MGLWNSLVDALKIDSEEDDDDLLYEDDLRTYERKERRRAERAERKPRIFSRPQRRQEDYDYYDDQPYDNRRDLSYEARNSVPPRSPVNSYTRPYRNTEVQTIKAYSFADAEEICGRVVDGESVIVNLENTPVQDSQRIMDFIFGCIFAINGYFHPMSESSFLVSPSEINLPSYGVNRNYGNDSHTFNRMY